MIKRVVILSALPLIILGFFESAMGQGRFEIAIQSGNPLPDGNGTFQRFGRPSLNNAGQLAFTAEAGDTLLGRGDRTGVFLATASNVIQLGRAGSPATSGDSFTGFLNRFGFSEPALNDFGEVAFTASINDFSAEAIYLASAQSLTLIARTGDSSPTNNGEFSRFSSSALGLERPSITSLGNVSFTANLSSTQSGSPGSFGTFQYRGSDLVEIVRRGTPFPSGNGEFSGEFIGVNNSNQHLIADSGVFIESAGEFSQLLQIGQSVPGGNGTFSVFSDAEINDNNDIGVVYTLAGTSGDSEDDYGLYLLTDDFVLEIIREGSPAPDGNGFVSNILQPVAMNNAAQFVTLLSLTNTVDGSNDNSGIFLSDATGSQLIVRRGDLTPDGNGVFSDFFFKSSYGINDSGNIVFEAGVDTTGDGDEDEDGIYLWYDNDIIQVARTGESLLGSTITALTLNAQEGFSDQNQLAFLYVLEDGRRGIVLFSPVPEPASFSLMLWAMVSMLGNRNQCKVHF